MAVLDHLEDTPLVWLKFQMSDSCRTLFATLRSHLDSFSAGYTGRDALESYLQNSFAELLFNFGHSAGIKNTVAALEAGRKMDADAAAHAAAVAGSRGGADGTGGATNTKGR